MIKLFRKTRLMLWNERQLKKYSIYAFGEILLVGVGILIALQINTWNEEKKERNFENYILKEIDANLEADLVQIEQNSYPKKKNSTIYNANAVLLEQWKHSKALLYLWLSSIEFLLRGTFQQKQLMKYQRQKDCKFLMNFLELKLLIIMNMNRTEFKVVS